MTKVILFSGKAEAGKTSAAKILRSELVASSVKPLRIASLPYGDYVKETAKLIYGWDGKKDEEGRHLLQHWGTDIVREKNPNFWVETVKRLVEVAKDELDYVIIDDCRFPNEVEAWKDFPTLLVRIERPGHVSSLTEEQLKHPSETIMDNYNFDMIISARKPFELYTSIQKDLMPLVFDLNKYGKICKNMRELPKLYGVSFDGDYLCCKGCNDGVCPGAHKCEEFISINKKEK